jgi:predicted CXXCH cytochrome family protein
MAITIRKLGLLFVAALAAPTVALAFHSGGVAECGGCHSMHSPVAGGSYLLVGLTQSDACLTCHGEPGQSSYHVATPDADLGPGQAPYNLTPGGDFGWLKKTYVFVVRGTTITEHGSEHGHNIQAPGHGYTEVDGTVSPGGAFPANQLACNSCHDPHGRYRRATGDVVSLTGLPIKASGSYNAAANEPDAANAVGSYRILAGAGYAIDSGFDPVFPGVPAAKVASSYNRSEAASSTRVAYGASISASGNTTWGNWCGACHGAMHSSGNYVHPVDQGLGSSIKNNYDAYVKSGSMTGANATAFTSLVPFATDGSGNTYAALATVSTGTAGPATTDQVNCMSCHRAHASGFPWMLRWQMEGEFIVYNSLYPGTDSTPTVPQFARGRTAAEQQKAYYDRPVSAFATYQRVLCNKCHAKD